MSNINGLPCSKEIAICELEKENSELKQQLDVVDGWLRKLLDEKYIMRCFIELLTDSDDKILVYAARECLAKITEDEK